MRLLTGNKNHKRPCASLYITPRGIAVAISSRVPKKLPAQIEVCCFFPFPQKKPSFDMVSTLLTTIGSTLDIKKHCVICILSKELYRMLLIDLPSNIAPKEFQSASKWLVKDLIDFSVDNLASDMIALPTENQHRKKAYVCISKKDQIQARQQQFINADLDLAIIDVPDLALTYLAQSEPAQKISVVLALLPTHPTILVTYQHELVFKHDIETAIDFSASATLQSSLQRLANEITQTVDFAVSDAQLKGPIEILLLPIAHHSKAVLNIVPQFLSYPMKVLDIHKLFQFSSKVDAKTLSQTLIPLGGILRTGVKR